VITRPYLHRGEAGWRSLVEELERLHHLIVPVNVINMTLMAMVHDVPLEDMQILHIVVVMIIIVATAIVVVVGVGSVTGTAA
jgi:hypothetical protein